MKNENAVDILDWEQGVKEIKSIRRAMKILDIGYEEVLDKPMLQNRTIRKNTNRDAFDFKQTITARYENRRKKNRQRRRILHILTFPFVAKQMTTLKDWRELYCVCKAWRDILSKEDVWRSVWYICNQSRSISAKQRITSTITTRMKTTVWRRNF